MHPGPIARLVLIIALCFQAVPGSSFQGAPSTIDGREVLSVISGSKGKVVLISFWATWCSSCRREIGELQALRSEFPKEDLMIAGISVDESPDALLRFLQGRSLGYPVYRAEKDVHYLFNLSGVPKTFVYDQKGQLALKEFGYIPARRLRKLISSLLEGR